MARLSIIEGPVMKQLGNDKLVVQKLWWRLKTEKELLDPLTKYVESLRSNYANYPVS